VIEGPVQAAGAITLRVVHELPLEEDQQIEIAECVQATRDVAAGQVIATDPPWKNRLVDRDQARDDRIDLAVAGRQRPWLLIVGHLLSLLPLRGRGIMPEAHHLQPGNGPDGLR
jgi:hypothetical protein